MCLVSSACFFYICTYPCPCSSSSTLSSLVSSSFYNHFLFFSNIDSIHYYGTVTITYIWYYFVWFSTTTVRYGMVQMVVVPGAICHEQEACGTRHETLLFLLLFLILLFIFLMWLLMMVYIICCMRPPSTTTTTTTNSSLMFFFFLHVSCMCLYFDGRRLLLLSIAVVALRYHPVALHPHVVVSAADKVMKRMINLLLLLPCLSLCLSTIVVVQCY